MNEFFRLADRYLEFQAEYTRQIIESCRIFSAIGLKPNQTPQKADITLRLSHIAHELQMPAAEVTNECIQLGTARVCTNGSQFIFSIDGSMSAITLEANNTLLIQCQDAQASHHLPMLLPQAISLALRRLNRFALHSAGLVKTEADIRLLLIGDSGSGKSTLTVRLAKQGWRFLSDDAIVLQDDASRIIASPLRRVFALTEQTVEACGIDPSSEITEGKHIICPAELFPAGQIEQMLPNHLVFPVIKALAISEIRPLTQANALMRLLYRSPWAVHDPVTGEAHLKVLSRLAQTTQAWELHAGRDLLEQPERASELLGSLGS